MGKDLLGGLGPGERVAAIVAPIDELGDRGDQFLHAGEGAAPNGLSGDDAEEHFDEVEPRA